MAVGDNFPLPQKILECCDLESPLNFLVKIIYSVLLFGELLYLQSSV